MGAGVMLLCGNKTLVLKRAHYKNDKWSGFWNFPGGQGEPDESPYDTALRETLEETGLSPDHYQVVDHVGHQSDTFHYVMFIGICKSELTPTLDHEHTEWKWVPISLIPDMEMHPKDMRGFKRFYQLR